jgi:hypothetical protein
MDYTPRQLQAFLFLATKRRQRELREQLHTNALAAHGDEKAIRTQLREWEN